MPFETFDLSVTYGGGGQIWLSAVSSIGAVHGVSRQLPHGNILEDVAQVADLYGSSVRRAIPNRELAAEVGRSLRALVFDAPDISLLFHRTRGAAAAAGQQILVRILAAPYSCAALPWELIYDPEFDGPLTLTQDCHMVRLGRVRTYPLRNPLVQAPLRMLLVLSSPRFLTAQQQLSFDIYEEKHEFLRELDSLIRNGFIEVDVEDRPTLENLRARIATRPNGYNILHYVGHGSPLALELEERNGRSLHTEAAVFTRLLQDCPELLLVFFCGCETGRVPEEATSGVPPMSITDICVRDACQVVIGMQALLPMRTERLLSRFFYESIASGKSVPEALRTARGAVNDNQYVGRGLLDWSVPILFVGGVLPERLLTGRSAAKPARPQRFEVRLDYVETDREYFTRHQDLRVAVDFVSGRTDKRVLWITGPPGVNKMALLDRALTDASEHISYLFFCPFERLLSNPDPVAQLCGRLTELFATSPRPLRSRLDGWTASEWWDQVLDDIRDSGLVVALSDLQIGHPLLPEVQQALRKFVQRRGTRLVFLADNREDAFLPNLQKNWTGVIRLQPLGWDEVWSWIQRNRPALTRYDQDDLAKCFSRLKEDLELWGDVSDYVEDADPTKPSPSIDDAVDAILSARRPETALGAREMAMEATGAGLQVACAGPFIEGRQAEFAKAMTAMAAEYGVSGYVTGEPSGQDSTQLAHLLPIPSPFGKDCTATSFELTQWLVQALEHANIILADFGSSSPNEVLEHILEHARQDRLIVAASSNSSDVSYPAWTPSVLAVGPLDENGDIFHKIGPRPDGSFEYAAFDPALDKPELFTLASVKGTLLEKVLKDPSMEGSSFASLHVVSAAVLVWCTDPQQTAGDVKRVLLSTAEKISSELDGKPVTYRKLDIKAALQLVRVNLIKATLLSGPLELNELIAACTLAPSLANQVIDVLWKEGQLIKSSSKRGDVYQLSPASSPVASSSAAEI